MHPKSMLLWPITVVTFAILFCWVVAINVYVDDEAASLPGSRPYRLETNPLVTTSVSLSISSDVASHGFGFAFQTLGLIASLASLWYANRAESKVAGALSFLICFVFFFTWMTVNAEYMTETIYHRDGIQDGVNRVISQYARRCSDSFTVTTGKFIATASLDSKYCDSWRAGGGFSIILGLCQALMVVAGGMQYQSNTAAGADVSGLVKGLLGLSGVSVVVGSVIRAAGALRVAQTLTATSNVISDNSNLFTGGAIYLHMLVYMIVVVCAAHVYYTPSDDKKPISTMATAQVNGLMSLVLIIYSITSLFWDGRALTQDVYHKGIVPPCSTGGHQCDVFRALFAGEVIVAAGCVIAGLVGLLSILHSRNAGHTAPTAHAVACFEAPSKVVCWLAQALVFVLIMAWGISNFVLGVDGSANLTDDLGTLYLDYLASSAAVILSIATLVYYRYSTQTHAVRVACSFAAMGILWAWGLFWYKNIRDYGTNFNNGAHRLFCDPTENGVMMTGDNPLDKTLCYGSNIAAVCLSLYGIVMAVIVLYFLILAPFRCSDNPALGCFGGNRERLTVPQVLTFAFCWVGLIGLLILGGASINYSIKTAGSVDVILFSIGAQVFAVAVILSLMFNVFVAFNTDANAIDRAIGSAFLLTAITVTLGFILLPAAGASQDKDTYTIGKTICDTPTLDDEICSSRKAGAGGIFLCTLGAVFQGLFLLIIWRQNRAKVGDTRMVGMANGATGEARTS